MPKILYFSILLLSSVDCFLHIRSPDRALRQSQRRSTRVPTYRNENYKAQVQGWKSNTTEWRIPLARTTRFRNPNNDFFMSQNKGNDAILTADCQLLKIDGHSVIENYRGAAYYQKHTTEQTFMKTTGEGASEIEPHNEVATSSKFEQGTKKLQCVGQFENRCGRFETVGDGFSVVIVGFNRADAGTYSCVTREGVLTGSYIIRIKENNLPSYALHQPSLFIDIQPHDHDDGDSEEMLEQSKSIYLQTRRLNYYYYLIFFCTLDVWSLIVANLIGGILFIITVGASVLVINTDENKRRSALALRLSTRTRPCTPVHSPVMEQNSFPSQIIITADEGDGMAMQSNSINVNEVDHLDNAVWVKDNMLAPPPPPVSHPPRRKSTLLQQRAISCSEMNLENPRPSVQYRPRTSSSVVPKTWNRPTVAFSAGEGPMDEDESDHEPLFQTHSISTELRLFRKAIRDTHLQHERLMLAHLNSFSADIEGDDEEDRTYSYS